MALLLWKNYNISKAVKILVGNWVVLFTSRTFFYRGNDEIYFLSIQCDSYYMGI